MASLCSLWVLHVWAVYLSGLSAVCVLLQAPQSLLESLETHLNTLEGKKP